MAEPQSREEALAAKKARNTAKAEAKKVADGKLEAKREQEKQHSISISDPNLPQKQEGIFAGTAGYSFTFREANFGSTLGIVTLNGEELEITSWSAVRVKGQLPKHAEHGEVTATLSDGHTVVARYGV